MGEPLAIIPSSVSSAAVSPFYRGVSALLGAKVRHISGNSFEMGVGKEQDERALGKMETAFPTMGMFFCIAMMNGVDIVAPAPALSLAGTAAFGLYGCMFAAEWGRTTVENPGGEVA